MPTRIAARIAPSCHTIPGSQPIAQASGKPQIAVPNVPGAGAIKPTPSPVAKQTESLSRSPNELLPARSVIPLDGSRITAQPQVAVGVLNGFKVSFDWHRFNLGNV
jgi:hypothetical protein